MTVTSPLVLFGDNAIAIKDDATFSCSDKQSFVVLSELTTELSAKRLITYEPDMWLLDGNYKFVPTDPQTGLVNAVLSSSISNFAAPVVLTITFGSVHSTTGGITLHFNDRTNDYIDNVDVAYYNSSNSLIRTDNYHPTTTEYATGQAVSNFKKIIITMNSTNKNYRFARLVNIDFDTVTRFQSADIQEAQLVEAIDPTSIELPFNTLDLTLFSSDGDFSIVDPAGVFAILQYKKPVDAYENIDDNLIYLGRFYLDEWNSESENIATLHAVDIIGILDKITYQGDLWIPNIYDASTVIPFIINAAGVGTGLVSIDASLNSVKIFGDIPVGSYREALQHCCIGIGGYATCARSKYIQVRPIEIASGLSVFDYTITSAEKHLNSPVKLRPLVTGIEIFSHEYIQDAAAVAQTLFDGDLAIGTHTIIFGVPAWGTSETRTGGLLGTTVYHNDYVIATITTAGHLLITGKVYADNQKVISQYNGSLPSGTVPNIIRIEDATTANKNNTSTLVSNFYSYYSQRYIQQTKLFASLIAVGDSVLIDTQASKQIKGIVEKMTTDLAGGFISELDIIGVVV